MAINIRDPRFQKFAFVFIILGCVLYVYFLTDWMPFTYKANAAELDRLEDRYRDISKDLNKARQTVDRLPYLEKEYELLQRKWEQGKTLLPDEKDIIGLLRTITVLGTNAGIVFTKFEPKTPQPADGYTAHPVEIKVEGGYHEIGTFLGELANMSRIINVTQLNVETAARGRHDIAGRPAQATFVALAYTLGGIAPTVAADGTSGGGSPATANQSAGKPAGGEGE